MTSREPLVRCVDVTRIFGSGPAEVVAVRHATCEVHAGDRIAITGPSGSGKSTLLHMLGALERPTAGDVTWPGLRGDPLANPGQIGTVFQAPSLLPPLDVRENVALPLLISGDVADLELRVETALQALGVEQLGRQLPEELSGGQAQRVAVARVLAMAPVLILADEPTGQLDAEHGRRVIDALMETAHRLGAALVVATHDEKIADRFLVRWTVDDGQVLVGVNRPTDDAPEPRSTVEGPASWH
jgi:ABC-type lipoprotein export system ATPase subunit